MAETVPVPQHITTMKPGHVRKATERSLGPRLRALVLTFTNLKRVEVRTKCPVMKQKKSEYQNLLVRHTFVQTWRQWYQMKTQCAFPLPDTPPCPIGKLSLDGWAMLQGNLSKALQCNAPAMQCQMGGNAALCQKTLPLDEKRSPGHVPRVERVDSPQDVH